MPWQETSPMEERERFIADHRHGLYTMTELCAHYGVSRKTGYKWRERFEAGGRLALRDQSRAPKHCPHKILGVLAELLCAARCAHPTWGPEKLVDWLAAASGRALARREHHRGPVAARGPGEEAAAPAPYLASGRGATGDAPS